MPKYVINDEGHGMTLKKMKHNDCTCQIIVKIPFAKGTAKFHPKSFILHHLMKELNATLMRNVDEVFGHPIDIHLGYENV